jgi:hypothetical protein
MNKIGEAMFLIWVIGALMYGCSSDDWKGAPAWPVNAVSTR